MKKTTAALLKSAALLPGKAGGCGPVLLGRRPSARRVLLSWLCCRSSFWLQLLAAFRRWHLCSSLLPLAAGNLACNCCACSTPAGNVCLQPLSSAAPSDWMLQLFAHLVQDIHGGLSYFLCFFCSTWPVPMALRISVDSTHRHPEASPPQKCPGIASRAP